MADDYDKFVEENSNGWVVVYIGKERAPKRLLFVNVTGPYLDQPDALRAAATMRRRYRAAVRHGDPIASDMVKVSVRPLWKRDT